MRETYTAPHVSDVDLTPSFVRDELLRCFESANQQFFDLLGQPVTDEQLRVQVREFVTGVFQECGLPFETPTKEGIRTAIDRCKGNAEGMMDEQVALGQAQRPELSRLRGRPLRASPCSESSFGKRSRGHEQGPAPGSAVRRADHARNHSTGKPSSSAKSSPSELKSYRRASNRSATSVRKNSPVTMASAASSMSIRRTVAMGGTFLTR